MSLNKLHIFKTVYECGNTADAAALLKVTRPAISQNLSRLEDELGISLFTRLPKGLIPTPQGHQLARSIGPLLDQLNIEINAVSHNQDSRAGVLHIGAPQATGTLYMPRIVERFNALYPNVEIHLYLENSTLQLARLMKGELDFAIIDVYGGEELHRNFQSYCFSETLVKEFVVLACSPQYYEENIAGDLSFDKLSSLDFLTTRDTALELKSWFHDQFGKIPTSLTKRVIANNGIALIDCARRHLGAFANGSNLIKEYVERGELIEITPRSRGENNSICLAQLLDKKPSALEKAFITVLKDYAKFTWGKDGP
ncbi:LysR family transcriptional regulator [Terasakiella sp.]|uniref:LysR family transcriptional regulator n=1 Tax=Terasakiella sp. TaxID=2034861 RepID=UPI003AA82746